MLIDTPPDPRATLILAHGSGLPMDSEFMNAFTVLLVARDIEVVRFEFAYMATRRTGGSKRPPPRAEKLLDEYRAAIEDVSACGPLLIGGKSLGGRVASMVADEEFAAGRVQGLVCLGYPFHPPKKPEKLRTAHLTDLACPALICQGTRDEFGRREEVAGYKLSTAIKFAWAEDGDHHLTPRKRSGRTAAGNHAAASDAIADFVRDLTPSP